MKTKALTTAEVAKRLGVSARRVRQLLELRADFPRPVATVRGAFVFDGGQVDRWASSADRSVGRPAKVAPAASRNGLGREERWGHVEPGERVASRGGVGQPLIVGELVRLEPHGVAVVRLDNGRERRRSVSNLRTVEATA